VRLLGFHQILVGAAPGDAITSMALALRTALRALGPSEIYALHRAPEMLGEVFPLEHLPELGRDGVIVYHSSYGEPAMTQFLLAREERLVVAYHNVTPASFYLQHAPAFAAGLEWGRREVELLRSRAVAAVADSHFNADELAGMGYTDVRVVPAGLRPGRLTQVIPDGLLGAQLRAEQPGGFVLSVSQVLPHKRFELLIEAMHLVQWVHERPLGLVVVGNQRMPEYAEALHGLAVQLNVRNVRFTGAISDRGLSAYYRSAEVFATTSAHEGLAVPPLEAMSFGLPVVATGCGALGETIAGAGLVLPPSAGPELISEAIVAIHDDARLRHDLSVRGFERVAEVEAHDPSDAFLALMCEVVGR